MRLECGVLGSEDSLGIKAPNAELAGQTFSATHDRIDTRKQESRSCFSVCTAQAGSATGRQEVFLLPENEKVPSSSVDPACDKLRSATHPSLSNVNQSCSECHDGLQ